MAAESVGRKLGIGLRLAAKAVQQHTANTTSPAGASPAAGQPAHPTSAPYSRLPTSREAAQAATRAKSKAGGIAQGAKRFFAALWAPVAHTGGVLWLEITGLFFALFAGFFAQNVYKFRFAWKSGADHTHFLVYAALAVLFTWFTFSSFYKARQKERRNRARRAAR